MFPAIFLQIIVVLIICGLFLWISQQIPMDPVIRQIVRVICVVFIVVYLCWVLIGIAPGPLFYRR